MRIRPFRDRRIDSDIGHAVMRLSVPESPCRIDAFLRNDLALYVRQIDRRDQPAVTKSASVPDRTHQQIRPAEQPVGFFYITRDEQFTDQAGTDFASVFRHVRDQPGRRSACPAQLGKLRG